MNAFSPDYKSQQPAHLLKQDAKERKISATRSRQRAEGLASCLGTALGGLLHVLAAALGLSLIVAQSALAFGVVKAVASIRSGVVPGSSARDGKAGTRSCRRAMPPIS